MSLANSAALYEQNILRAGSEVSETSHKMYKQLHLIKYIISIPKSGDHAEITELHCERFVGRLN